MSEVIEVSSAPLLPQQAGDQLIAVRNGAIVRVTMPVSVPLALVATTGYYGDLSGLPNLSLVGLGAATAAQGLLAETAVQPDAIAGFETTTQLDARDVASKDRANHTGTQSAATIDDFGAVAAAAAPVQSVAGRGGNVTLAKADVGLGQVDNTPDSAKPISEAAQAALDLKLEAGAIASFEAATQLDARDTVNRNRANHTGVQAISTVTGLQLALDLKLEAGAIAAFETSTQLNTRDAANRNRANHTGAQAIDTITGLQTALNQKLESPAIASFESTAALNARDTANRARSNHTGSQAISTVTGLQPALDLKLEAGAIAAFETSTQLNTRDAANRNRGNHTGSQAASTITGLAPVATSGVYADLTGKPIIPAGFTYDQQLEPGLPGSGQILVAGQTWRERSAQGLRDWEWTGSLWLSPRAYAIATTINLSAVGNTFGIGAVCGSFLESVWIAFRQTTTPNLSESIFYTIETRIRRDDGVTLEAARFSAFTSLKAANTRYIIPINRLQSLFDEAGINLTVTSATGSPGAGRVQAQLIYRMVR